MILNPKNLIVLGNKNSINKETVSLIDLESIKPLTSLRIEGQEIDFNSNNIQIKTKLFNLEWYYNFLKDYQYQKIIYDSPKEKPNVSKEHQKPVHNKRNVPILLEFSDIVNNNNKNSKLSD